MSLGPLNSELLYMATQQLNEDPKRTQEALDYLREWIQKQPHLTVRTDDRNLINFIRSSKWSMERAKERIDCFYTARTLYPIFFSNRDPFLPEIQRVLNAGIFLPLPNVGVGPKTCFVNFSNVHTEMIPAEMIGKVVLMSLDVLKIEDERLAYSGLRLIVDYKDSPSNYLVQLTPKLMKSFLTCLLDAYPIRFHSYTGLHIPDVLARLINTVLYATLNEKTRKKMVLYGSNGNDFISKTLDKSILPKELGGTHGSFAEIAAQWKEKIESYKDWFLEDTVYRSNESLRIGKSKHRVEEFGVDGTFMKLNID